MEFRAFCIAYYVRTPVYLACVFSAWHINALLCVALSCAATYQSVPQVNTGKGCCHWVTNPFPPGLDLDTVSDAVRSSANQLKLTRVPIIVLNGFCFMFKIALLDVIGSFDKVNFPLGYGEEVDYSLRAYNAGFKAYVVPAVYLYHEKTASFTEKSKKTLKKSANPTLKLKYNEELKIANNFVQSITKKELESYRDMISAVYNSPLFEQFNRIHSFSVIFLYDVKSAQSDILRTQLYQISTLLSLGIKVSIGVAQDSKSIFLRNVRFLNLDPKQLLEITHFHPDSKADTDFLTSLKFMKIVESHDIIVGHSCTIVTKLVQLFPNLAKHMIVYQLNDYILQKVDQFKTTYHKDSIDSCTNKLAAGSNIHIVANTDTNAKEFSNIYHPTYSVVSDGLSLDQNVYYIDDLLIKLRLQHLQKKGAVENKRPKYITFYFSAASFSLHSTSEFILEVAYALIQHNPNLIHITVAHFGVVDTSNAFLKHLMLKKNVDTMQKLKFLEESKHFHYFSGNDLKYGTLLRKTHAFIDMTHGHFSEQRVLEAMACGALVMTSPGIEVNRFEIAADMFFVDAFENVEDTVAGIAKMLFACDGDVYDRIISRYMNIVMKYKLEPKAAEWAVRTNKQFIAYRANHISTSVDIVL